MQSTWRALFCLITVASGNVLPVLADSNLRIERNGLNPSAQSNARARPLEGSVEHRAKSPVEYYPGQNSLRPPITNGNGLQGRTDNSQLNGGATSSAGQFNMGTPFANGTPQFDNARPRVDLNVERSRMPGDINDAEMNVLKDHDIVIMQDRSSSMGEKEHFPQGKFSRWNWCAYQASDFARQTARIPNWTFDVVLFSSQYDYFRGVRLAQVPQVFDRSGIYVGTKLAQPLSEQLNAYFRRAASGPTKPLIIVVISDGKPQDDEDLCDVIINATHHLRNPDDVHIEFLQIGTDDEGQKKLNKFDFKLVRKGARFDIVSVMPYMRVTQLGLTRSILEAAHMKSNL